MERQSGLDDLLEPTLREQALAKPLFSIRANFFVAFFGGIFASAVFTALNAHRMGRLQRELWVSLPVLALWVVLYSWAASLALSETPPEWLSSLTTPARTLRWIGRGSALAFFGLHYLRSREVYRGQSWAGVEPPSPWIAAIASVVIGTVVAMGLGVLALRLQGAL